LEAKKYTFNKLTSVVSASVLLLMVNCLITLSKWLWKHEPQASGSTVNFGNVMTQFIVNNRTDDVNLFIYKKKTPKLSNAGINEGKRHLKLSVNKDE